MTPKQWLEIVTEHGCVVTGRSDIQRHHVFGRKYKQDKVHIGEFYVIPLWWELHDISSNHPNNVTHYPKRFAKAYGMQKVLFAEMVETLQNGGHEIPSDEILRAIGATSR